MTSWALWAATCSLVVVVVLAAWVLWSSVLLQEETTTAVARAAMPATMRVLAEVMAPAYPIPPRGI